MGFSSDYRDQGDKIIALFSETFTASEGPEEGQLIGKLVQDLLSQDDGREIRVFSAWQGDSIIGCAIFSRMVFDRDDRTVFILSPMAVRTRVQGQKIGQRLLTHALEELRRKGVDVAITYGDPNFYAKVGFAQITEDIAQAPLRLTYPEGWLGQSLTERPLDPLNGSSHCVRALDDPDYW